jgi:hypothetical protein
MNTYDDAMATLAELERQQQQQAREHAKPDPEQATSFEEQLAHRLHAAQSRWLTINDRENQ